MENNLNFRLQDFLNDIFIFSGLLSAEGFLLDLQGEIFIEAGVSPELLIGHKFSETIFWQSQEHTSEVLQKAIDDAAQGLKSKTQIDFRVSAQKNLIVELTFNPVFDDSEMVKEILFFALDVSEREREIEFHKTRGEHLLYAAEAAEIGLWFWDLKKDEIFTSPKCNEIYELPPHELITSNSFLKALHPEDKERVINNLQQAKDSDQDYNIEYRLIYTDGSIQWLKVSGKTFFDSERIPVSMMGVVRKITGRKIASDELTKINESVVKARDEAEEANRAKDYFLAIVSHELRSPLNSILGWSKILLTKEVDDSTRRNALETIERSARAQAKLIEDLVDSSRIASGKLRLDLQPVSLFKIVKNAFNSQQPTAAARNIHFELVSNTEQADVYGDPVRLQQVFTNLLTNALKFTSEGGTVRINFESALNLATISVSDSGQGISPEFLPAIFKQFAQADDKVSRDKSGLGLGLAIVKTLVEKHGGGIKAESGGIGQGAKFTVTLPLLAAVTVDF